MAVIELAKLASKDTQNVLRSLLDLSLQGELAGVTVAYRERSGREDFAFTGLYRDRPSKVVNAATRLIIRLARLQDEADDEE